MEDLPESSADAWMERAEHDLVVARDLAELGHWAVATFQAQQAAEKSLKAVQIQRHRAFDKTHDLTRLTKLLKAGPEVQACAERLSPYYTAARYPDAEASIEEAESRAALRDAEEVLRWARTQLS